MKGSVGLSGLAVLGGIWIGIAPFWVGYAPKHGSVFTGATALSVWMGAIIVVAGLIGLVGYWAGGLGETVRRLREFEKEQRWQKRRAGAGAKNAEVNMAVAAEPETIPDPVDGEEDTEAKLQELVDRVLKDHSLAFEKHS